MYKLRNNLLLILSILLSLVMVTLTVFADNSRLEIVPITSTGLFNNEDLELELSITNDSNNQVEAYLLTVLYDAQTYEMQTYNYLSVSIEPNSNTNWGSCLTIPAQGTYRVKVFAVSDPKERDLLSNIIEIHQEEKPEPLNYKDVLEDTSKYLLTTTPQAIHPVGGEWTIFGLARSEAELDETLVDEYYKNAIQEFKSEMEGTAPFDGKVTDVQRLAIALGSLEKDITDIEGYNLLDFTWNKADYFKNLSENQQTLGGRQGINELILGLLNIDLFKAEETESIDISREEIIEKVLEQYQVSTGGFSIAGGDTADVDVTAMTITALSPYYSENTKVKTAIDAAIKFLATKKFTTSENVSYTIVALSSLEIDSTKNEYFSVDLVEELLKYYLLEGKFSHTINSEYDLSATEQAHCALVAYNRFVNEESAIYDFSDIDIVKVEIEVQEETEETTESEEEQIEATIENDKLAEIGKATLSIEKRTIGKGDTLSPTEVSIYEGDSAWDIIVREIDARNIDMEHVYYDSFDSYYITEIEGDKEFDYGANSGWLYYVNNEMPDVGISQYLVEDGDVLRIRYSTSWGNDLSGYLVNLLEKYCDDAEGNYNSDDFTESSYAILQNKVNAARQVIDADSYQSYDEKIEYLVSGYIADIVAASKGLVRIDTVQPQTPSTENLLTDTSMQFISINVESATEMLSKFIDANEAYITFDSNIEGVYSLINDTEIIEGIRTGNQTTELVLIIPKNITHGMYTLTNGRVVVDGIEYIEEIIDLVNILL